MNYIAKILLNSFYGRFGMDDNFTEISILDSKLYSNFEKKHADLQRISDIIELDDKILVQAHRYNMEILLDNGSETQNINIAIASAITGYARIYMSQFKNNPNFKLFYSDTDSIYINKPLSKEYISSSELGKLKLEYICNKDILNIWVYGGLTDSYEYIKIKGLKNPIHYNELKSLLIKDRKLEIYQ